MESKKGSTAAAASLSCLLLLGMLIILPSGFNSFCAAEATAASLTTTSAICGNPSKYYIGRPCDVRNCARVCQQQEGGQSGLCLLDKCFCTKQCP